MGAPFPFLWCVTALLCGYDGTIRAPGLDADWATVEAPEHRSQDREFGEDCPNQNVAFRADEVTPMFKRQR